MGGFFDGATKDSSGKPNSRLWLHGFLTRGNLDFFLFRALLSVRTYLVEALQ